MTNNEIFYFTGKCLTIEEHAGFREEIIEKIKDDSIDWQRFVGFCSNHLILPLIYAKFQSQHIIEFLPDELSEYLKEIYDLNLTRNNQILKQLQEITEILNQNNIYPVFLKGTGHLLNGLYSNIGERMIGDIDFLVPEKEYLLAAQLIEKEGYSADCPEYLDVKSIKHYPRLFKSDVPADIEVHRLPVSEEYQSWFNPEIIFDEKKTVSSLNGCFVLSNKHNIILNFIHSQLLHGGHLNGIVSFRDLYDLYLLSKRFEIKQTIPEIGTKQKAIAYFVFAGKAFGLKDRFYPESNLSSWLFIKKLDLNHSSPAFYHAYRTTVYFMQRIFVGYVGQFIKSFYSKKVRRSVIQRVSNRQWYIAHLNSYKSFFSNNK